MANTINLAKVYAPLIDELYRASAKSTVLNSNEAYIRQGANAKEILYPQVNVNGLGDYSRNNGYTNNAVDVQWKTATFNYDRGTKISVDSMDDQETFNIAFSGATSTLIRDKVAPEADAFTFATIAGAEGISVAVSAPENGLQEADVAVIADIVMTQSDYDMDDIRVVEVQ